MEDKIGSTIYTKYNSNNILKAELLISIIDHKGERGRFILYENLMTKNKIINERVIIQRVV